MENAWQAKKVVVLGTGGTIAGRAEQAGDNVGYVAGQVPVAELLGSVAGAATQALEAEQVAQIDSRNMDLAVWQALVRRLDLHLAREDVAGVVVTHGTDTLEETAFLLHSVLRPAKPVVLTCAMRPATALVPDGPQNLADALVVARHPGAGGVVVVCAGEVHSALDVSKVHTYRTNAFDSGDAGPLACIEEGRLRMFRTWVSPPVADEPGFQQRQLAAFLASPALPRVELLTSHADADGWQVKAMLAHGGAHPAQAVRGLVVAGTGNGSVHDGLTAALRQAEAAGIPVVRASRCARGRVIPHSRAPFPDSGGLTPVKARIALALSLLLN